VFILDLSDHTVPAAATWAVATLTAGNGHAAAGRWLRHARRLLAPYPEAIRHVQLVVAGRFSGESAQQVASSAQQCAGIFTCDCRGVGANWCVAEVRAVSYALLGSIDVVPGPEGLTAQLVVMTDNAMSKSADGTWLRLRTTPGTEIRFVRQTAPALENLSARGTGQPDDPADRDYPAGAWGPGESREYHIGLGAAPPGPAGGVTVSVVDAQGVTRGSSSPWMT
jgi:hypothetical protein